MDYSNMLKMSYELNPDTFETGKAYRIKIHKPDLFSRAVEVSLCVDDDDSDYDITTAYGKLYNHLNEIGVDAICIRTSTKFVEFITSTRNVKRDIVKMTIRITLDDIMASNENENAGITPEIEILEMKPAVPDMLFRDIERPEGNMEKLSMAERFMRGDFCGGIVEPGKEPHKTKSLLDRVFRNNSDDSTTTGDNK